jgi:hypothetical protein
LHADGICEFARRRAQGQRRTEPDLPRCLQDADTSSGPTSVKTDGKMPMTKSAKYMMSTGDEAGSAMGVISNKVKGACEYMMYSFDVKFEGKEACRLGDPLFHNEKNGMG